MTASEEIKQKVDIVEIIGQYVTLTKAGRNLRGLCPFHSEKHPSFFVYPEQQSWHCFGACNTGGDIFAFLMKKQDCTFGEALRLLADRAGVTLAAPAEAEKDKKARDRLYEANQAAAQYYHDRLLRAVEADKTRDYLAGRGLKLSVLTDFQLGYSPKSWDALKQYLGERGFSESELADAGLIVPSEKGAYDRFRNKIMFPIYNIKGDITGFGARVLDDSLPKYINSPQTAVFDKSSCLYGINRAKDEIKRGDMVIIVEGYMDVITAHQFGVVNVVAPMGTAINEKQINILKRLTKNMVLALDADSAGEEAMLRGITYENALGAEVRVMTLPPGRDPDEVIKEDINQWQGLVSQAVPVTDYIFAHVAQGLDLSSAKNKSGVADQLLPVIAGINDPVRQAHYLQKLASLVRVNVASLESALAKLKTRPKPGAARPVLEKGTRPVFSSPIEEYCLALLLQHPEISPFSSPLLPEYFENTENREVFLAYRAAEDIKFIRGNLDDAVREHFDLLVSRKLTSDNLAEKLADVILHLREKYLRNLENKTEALLALEKETGGTPAELAKLQELGIEVSAQLGEVFNRRNSGTKGKGGINGR